MIWQKGMFLLFKNSIAKITSVYTSCGKPTIGMRKFSKGTTKNGYSWQHKCRKSHLDNLYKKDRVKVVPAEEVLACVFYNYEGMMPIENMEEVY